MKSSSKTKVALVTGSGRKRVGYVIARALAEDGYAVGLHYHSSAVAAEATAEEMRGIGADCEAFRANVAVERDVDQMFEAVSARFGRLDVLVTTASVWETFRLEDLTADEPVRARLGRDRFDGS